MDPEIDMIGVGGAGGFLASSLYRGGLRPRIISRGAALRQLQEVGLTIISEDKRLIHTPMNCSALDDEMIVRPTTCSWRRAAPREMMRGRRPPRYSEEARKPPAPPTPIMSISGFIPPPWYKLCCTTLPRYRNQVTEHSIGCRYDAWFLFHYRDCTHSFGFERDDACRPCANMQGVIRANAAWSNVSDEHAMFAMCLAHQADG